MAREERASSPRTSVGMESLAEYDTQTLVMFVVGWMVSSSCIITATAYVYRRELLAALVGVIDVIVSGVLRGDATRAAIADVVGNVLLRPQVQSSIAG